MQQRPSIGRLMKVAALFSLLSLSSPGGGAWLGITVQNVSAQMAFQLGLGASSGVMVMMVQEGGPAAQAGIRQGDVIVKLNQHNVENNDELRDLIAKLSPGSLVRLELIRDREEIAISIQLGQRPRAAA